LDPMILAAERRIFQAQDLLLWPADWQKDTADHLYDLTDAQSVIVPWGANIDDPGPPHIPEISPDRPLEILFIGRDWLAKGGPLVLAVVQALRAAGQDARLTVVGCVPPGAPEPWMKVHPSLDKADPVQLATLQSLFQNAHFVMMASFESWGFAFCEASAYGVPSLCLRTGGVPVRDGVNGYALPPGADADAFVAIIQRYLTDPPAYQALCTSARQEYEERLNWQAWGQSVSKLLHRQAPLQPRD
ncbi:MAG TPA: glycosyltransferase, partial [Aliiroseovarius sp.]|nr:glycosyltransferase [Aliiroseovarius sp.]